ncbi:hypothetical protein VCRA2119O147_460022 [Vibrio crassostreae]|nr:hypothetical protein VCRA2113O206_100040 [Vibrio crassostreae]CAK1697938.1 hypothetical protein VCRA2110O178_100060 [Vibrio crassostreae]CAK1705453.1 hypothetical protein VCRA2113O228_100126 [Vibrio crassostreae]CAK1739367.1 hypothetical protein VCRA2113O196_120091 [Vibrio crassostreae]CAK1798828.1 hypothetical protein VCRA2112O187_1510005 [Vibrio crassostreae]
MIFQLDIAYVPPNYFIHSAGHDSLVPKRQNRGIKTLNHANPPNRFSLRNHHLK